MNQMNQMNHLHLKTRVPWQRKCHGTHKYRETTVILLRKARLVRHHFLGFRLDFRHLG